MRATWRTYVARGGEPIGGSLGAPSRAPAGEEATGQITGHLIRHLTHALAEPLASQGTGQRTRHGPATLRVSPVHMGPEVVFELEGRCSIQLSYRRNLEENLQARATRRKGAIIAAFFVIGFMNCLVLFLVGFRFMG